MQLTGKLGWLAATVLGVFVIATFAGIVSAGPLDPAGPPASTQKTQNEVEPRTPISALPITLSVAGSYYLTGNLTGVSGQNGITVSSSNVSIDLRGFTLAGVPGSLDGVKSLNAGINNVTVENGTVRAWGGDGVDLELGSGMRAARLTVDANTGTGIVVGQNSVVADCVAIGGNTGVRASEGSTVARCAVSGASLNGFSIFGSTITDCAAEGNVNGVRMARGTIARCQINLNTGIGISVQSDALVHENNVYSNGTGIAVSVGGTGARIERNNVIANGIGIDINAAGNVIIGNSARGNTTANYDIVAGNTVGTIVTQPPTA